MGENGWLETYVRDNVIRHDEELEEIWRVINNNERDSRNRDNALDRSGRDTRWLLILYAAGGGFAGNALFTLAAKLLQP